MADFKQMKRSELKRVAFQRPEPKAAKGRLRKCAVCRTEFPPRSMTHKACGFECATELALRVRQAQERKAARADRAETKRKLDSLKTRSAHMKAAQVSFNRYVRLRAIRWGHACISSGAPLDSSGVGGGFDCGHYRSVGSAPHLRFNLNNAWGQSKQDNRYGAGAAFEYRRGLIALRGIDVVEALEADNRVRKFDIDYLKRIKAIFDKKANRIQRIIRLLSI